MSAIGGMPKKLDMWKKLIKAAMSDKNQSKQSEKIMDLEWERLETFKLSLMHFANANMYLHS